MGFFNGVPSTTVVIQTTGGDGMRKTGDGDWNGEDRRITHVKDPVDDDDVVTKKYLDDNGGGGGGGTSLDGTTKTSDVDIRKDHE